MIKEKDSTTNGSYTNLEDSFPKISLLKTILTPLVEKGLIVAFSGGVDSSFLLWAANEALRLSHVQGARGRVLALLSVSPSIPAWEIQEAKQFAFQIGAELSVVDSHELQQESYAKNDNNRCYFCKSELFTLAQKEAKQKGYEHIAYGYNATDRKDVRLGHVAAQEFKIHSPLDQAGLEKEEIRNLLRHLGFNIADKPASPCLASRVMTGVRVTEEKLHHIQEMESILRTAGLSVFRVRIHEEKTGNMATRYFRIEVALDEILTLLQVREKLVLTARRLGYRWLNLDLSGYRLGGGTIPS